MGNAAEYLTHQPDQLQRALVNHAVEDAVCILAGLQHAFVAQDGEVLRNIALRSADGIDDVLNTDLLVAHDAQDLETQRVRDSLEGARRRFDVFLLANELVQRVHSNIVYR